MKVLSCGNAAKMTSARDFEVTIHGIPIKLKGTPRNEALYRLGAAIRNHSIGYRNGLELLPHERVIFDTGALANDATRVPPAVLEPIRAGRTAINDIMSAASIHHLRDLANVFAKSQRLLTQERPCCFIEVHYVIDRQVHVALDAAFERIALSHFPTGDANIMPETVFEALKHMTGTDRSIYMSGHVQDRLEAVQLMVANLLSNLSPSVASVGSDVFYMQVLNRMSFFIRFTEVGGTLVGKAAIDKGFTRVEDSVADSSDTLEVGGLDLLNRFKWLLDAPQKPTLLGWVKVAPSNVTTKGSAVLPLSKPSVSVSAILNGKMSAKRTKYEPKYADIASFFG